MKNNIGTYIIVIFFGLLFLFLQASILNPLPIVHLPVNYLFVLSVCLSISSTISQRIFLSLFFGLLLDYWFSSCSFYTLSMLIINSLIFNLSVNAKQNVLFIILATFTGTLLIELVNASLIGFCLYTTPFNPYLAYKHGVFKMVFGNTLFSWLIFPPIKKYLLVKSTRL
jgi:hypothetical protein